MQPTVLSPGIVAFDRFRVEREAGRGGMGVVYRAHDLERGVDVALKILLSGEVDTEGQGRFVRESHTLASLGHPGIVRYVAHGRTPLGISWLAMEWLDGESLSELLRRGPLPIADAVRIARACAEALGVAHVAGVIHRDIKPGNLFLVRDPDGGPARVKVLDFGIARTKREGAHSLTTTGTVLGTPYYMAPEQARSLRGLDARADVWSLGAMLYEMLAGRRPFEHESVVAVLAAVLLEEPPPLAELRPDASPELIQLVTSCLDKNPLARPENGAVLADLLGGLDLKRRGPVSRAPRGLTEREQRVVFLVLALHTASGSDATVSDAGWSKSAAAKSPEGALRALAEAHGARVESLTESALVSILPDRGAPADQAAQAAKLALAMHAAVPTAALVVGAGRAELGVRLPVGDVVQRATELAAHARADAASSVRVDEIAATFLAGRFLLESDEHGARLVGRAEGDTSSRRRQSVPLVGRDRELRTLLELSREAHEEPVARVALLVGPPGIGKSRLLAELAQQLSEAGGTVHALRGEPLRASSPHGLAALLVRSAAGIEDGEPLAVRRTKVMALVEASVPAADAARTAVFLGEICRTPMTDEDSDPALRAARADAFLRGDLVERAFATWLRSACEKSPMSILVDDLPFVDEASITLFDRALKGAPTLPLFLVLAGRPSADLPPVLEDHEPIEVRLLKLSSKASRALMGAIAPGTTPELAERIVERAEGNPLFLEEMGRAARRGGTIDLLPTSVLAVVEERITELDPGARRVLRALSILGARASARAVSRLLGTGGGVGSVDDWLSLLERRDLVVSERAAEGEPVSGDTASGQSLLWSFRQPLVREAAYAMLTREDLRLGHRLAAELLAEASEPDAALVAAHFDKGDEAARAAEHYALAAEHTLGAHDLKGALARATRGLELGTDPLVIARLAGIKARAHRWRAEYDAAFTEAGRALAGHPVGTLGWLDAASTFLSAASQLGRASETAPLIETLLTQAPTEETRTALVVTVCRAGSALLARGDVALSKSALARAQALAASGSPEPLALAWCHVLGASHALGAGDVGAFALGTTRAVAEYERAGDARDAVNQRVRLGNAWTSLGVPARAEPVLRAARADARRMQLRLIEGYALQNLGHALDWLGQRAAAREALTEAIAVALELKDARLEAGARLYVAELERGAGEQARAERESGRASELVRNVPGFGAVAAAHHAIALKELSRLEEAKAQSLFATRALEEKPDAFEEGEVSIRRAHIEVLLAEHRTEEAKRAAVAAWERVRGRAERIADPELRETFLRQVPDHRWIAGIVG